MQKKKKKFSQTKAKNAFTECKMHSLISWQPCSVYRKESDSNESTESQLCNPMYLTPAWLPLESWEYPCTSWWTERDQIMLVG